ncbi:uncharacterized protein TNCV_3141821 [Trichonephila clavipes]|nr:uncharacterized protein TNCV_3141821 [Trichonephila clavipes]
MRSISPNSDFSTGKRIQKGYQIWRIYRFGEKTLGAISARFDKSTIKYFLIGKHDQFKLYKKKKPNPVSQKAYDRINAKIADISEALANASMKKAAAEEKIIDGTVNSVVVSGDGTSGRPVGILHLLEKTIAESAGKMEVCGMQKTFLRSEQKHGLKYQRYIGDGDSKTFLSIAEKEPYGDSVPIVKIECGGHV